MRRSADFRATVRHGVRVGRRTVVVHADRSPATSSPTADVLVGLVVSKAVGNAVTRNAVKRKLRHIAVECLPEAPAGSRVVLRALPAAWLTAVQRLRRRDGFS